MADSITYQIDSDSQNIIVKFNKQIVDREALIRFLDYLELESLRKRSQMTEEAANTLALSVEQSVWSKLKSHIGDNIAVK